ncbi:SixA phosphatase family protein [Thalassotalea fusca]
MKTKLLLLTLASLLLPAQAADNFTVYLVRHAEKQIEQTNPSLTHCGMIRANQLARILDKANIEKVYSTPYARTLETAAPLSKEKNISIKQYSPNGLDQLARELKQNGKNVLVVGHSNTTPVLAGLLAAHKLEPLSEKEYQMIYQVQFIEGKSNLTVLTHPLICQ